MSAKVKYKILYVGTLPPHPGGSAISNFDILNRLCDLGYSITALSPTTAATRSASVYASGHANLRIVYIEIPFYDSNPYEPKPDYLREQTRIFKSSCAAHIQQVDPDIVIIGRESFVFEIPKIAKRHQKPCLLLVKGLANSIVNKLLDANLSRRYLEEFAACDLMVTPAPHMTNALRELNFKHVMTIANAVDVETFFPDAPDLRLRKRLHIADGAPVLIHASNLKPIKRPHDLMALASNLTVSGRDYAFVIVGDGECRGELETLCKDQNLDGSVQFTGWVEHAKMVDYLRLADIAIMPSASEGLAAAYIEAQACAKTLIASDIPAARAVIANGRTGLTFAVGDIQELTMQVETALENPAMRARIGEKARQQTIENYALDDAVTQYSAVISDLVRAAR